MKNLETPRKTGRLGRSEYCHCSQLPIIDYQFKYNNTSRTFCDYLVVTDNLAVININSPP